MQYIWTASASLSFNSIPTNSLHTSIMHIYVHSYLHDPEPNQNRFIMQSKCVQRTKPNNAAHILITPTQARFQKKKTKRRKNSRKTEKPGSRSSDAANNRHSSGNRFWQNNSPTMNKVPLYKQKIRVLKYHNAGEFSLNCVRGTQKRISFCEGHKKRPQVYSNMQIVISGLLKCFPFLNPSMWGFIQFLQGLNCDTSFRDLQFI